MPRRDRRRDMARRRRVRDMRARRDRARDMGYDSAYDRAYDRGYYGSDGADYDYAGRGRGDSARRRGDRGDYADYGDYGYDMESDYARRRDRARRRRDSRRGGRDYASDEDYLEDDELMEWAKELLKDVEEKDKQMMTRENIIKRAKEMGIEFEDFTEDELVVTTLVMYTDYSKTLGSGNIDLFIKLAKDWLCDEDAEVQYGEKLAVYYEEIVTGE